MTKTSKSAVSWGIMPLGKSLNLRQVYNPQASTPGAINTLVFSQASIPVAPILPRLHCNLCFETIFLLRRSMS